MQSIVPERRGSWLRKRKDGTPQDSPVAPSVAPPAPSVAPPVPPAPPSLAVPPPPPTPPAAPAPPAGLTGDDDVMSRLERMAMSSRPAALARAAEEEERRSERERAEQDRAAADETALRAESLEVADRLEWLAARQAEAAPAVHAARAEADRMAKEDAERRAEEEARRTEQVMRDESLDVADRLAVLAVQHAERAPEMAARAEAERVAREEAERRAEEEAACAAASHREGSLDAAERLATLAAHRGERSPAFEAVEQEAARASWEIAEERRREEEQRRAEAEAGRQAALQEESLDAAERLASLAEQRSMPPAWAPGRP